MEDKNYTRSYLSEVQEICGAIDSIQVERVVEILLKTRSVGGRIFFLGCGGSAGNASHAVNDFRKIAEIECYAPTDNVSELTARTNDEGWNTVFVQYLITSKIGDKDTIFVLSVGGGDKENNISANIVSALELAKERNTNIVGIVGRDGGYTGLVADACVIVPTINKETVTPHTESFQAVIWHLIVTHPKILKNNMKWESTVT